MGPLEEDGVRWILSMSTKFALSLRHTELSAKQAQPEADVSLVAWNPRVAAMQNIDLTPVELAQSSDVIAKDTLVNLGPQSYVVVAFKALIAVNHGKDLAALARRPLTFVG